MENSVKNKKMLEKAFLEITKKYEEDDSFREKIIKTSREIIKPSKQAIYSIHRDDFSQSLKLIKTAEKGIETVVKIHAKSNLKEMGSLRAALEEYVEAKGYFLFAKEQKIILPADLPKNIHYETYLCGIADLTGEMSKRAVVLATKSRFDEVKIIKNSIEEVHELFLSFDFRSGELRKKAESIKYNLSKVENILYDISMRK
jgi:predicted translin family RNA/ssDNA-binding protein